MTHDRCCPLDDADGIECAVCDAITRARGDERAKFQQSWKVNLPRVEARNWMDGYRAATNGRPIPDWVITDTTYIGRA